MTTTPHDTGYAPDRWAFDDEVTRVFDDMLRRSIPQLDVVRALVTDTAATFARPLSAIVDLGCSRGESLAPLVARFGTRNTYLGVDVSGPMLDAARSRFAREIDDGIVAIEALDLRDAFPDVRASVVLSVLTLLFVPINYRQRIVRDVYAALAPGGAFVLVEKLLGAGSTVDAYMVERYHRFKAENGYTADEIERKRLALEGVQVPITAAWNEDLLRAAGFREIDCFWRWESFGAWVAVKGA
jgi:tRNA (cmo5U34)-methyltransferase